MNAFDLHPRLAQKEQNPKERLIWMRSTLGERCSDSFIPVRSRDSNPRPRDTHLRYNCGKTVHPSSFTNNAVLDFWSMTARSICPATRFSYFAHPLCLSSLDVPLKMYRSGRQARSMVAIFFKPLLRSVSGVSGLCRGTYLDISTRRQGSFS